QQGSYHVDRLERAASWAVKGANLTFVFDRPRRPHYLSWWIDRRSPAILSIISLNLDRLAPERGTPEDVAPFLQKISSLARLATSAGVQKREYLRRLEAKQPSPLTTGFLLDRARLVLLPEGLEIVSLRLFNQMPVLGGAALDFGKQAMTRLRDVLTEE